MITLISPLLTPPTCTFTFALVLTVFCATTPAAAALPVVASVVVWLLRRTV
ncbi:MAG: hypothetical protein IRY83_10150 [Chloroflexi bacterium]|nr:hypothetical protein [Chloroflexota bacterium]